MIEFNVGSHELVVEEPDLVVMRWHGAMSVNDLSTLSRELQKHCARWPYMLLLQNVTDLGGIPAEVRRFAPSGARYSAPLRGVAIVGAGFALRTVATLMLRVVNLTQRNADNPNEFFADETAARTWLASRRAALTEGGPNKI